MLLVIHEKFYFEEIPNYALLAKGNVLYENHTNKAPAVKRAIDGLLVKGIDAN